MDKLLISIIIPMYNAEKYIRRCIDSIREQSYQNWEVLVVNDGSKDHSKSICEEYAAADERFFLLDQENQGVSVARNHGIEKAKGEIILFVDADDWLIKDALDTVVRNWDEKSELVLFDYNEVSKDGVEKRRYLFKQPQIDFQKDEHYNKKCLEQALMGLYSEFHFRALIEAPWAKAFSAKYIKEHKVTFLPKVYMNEDKLYNLECVSGMQKIRYQSVPIYNYYVNETSITSTMFSTNGYKLLKNLEKCCNYLKEFYDKEPQRENKYAYRDFLYTSMQTILWWTANEENAKLAKKGHAYCYQNARTIRKMGIDDLGLSSKVIICLCSKKRFHLLELLIRIRKYIKKVLVIK